MVNVPTGTTLIEGDKLVTSGMGGIYPKGITIGKVTEVVNKKNPMQNEAIIAASVDFERLETVGVIVYGVEEEL